MHNVNLQKQLNIYDKQKKLVERELLQITKVREAIQQINKSLPKKERKFKKRGSTPKNGSSLVMKSGRMVKERKGEMRGQGVSGHRMENYEDGPDNASGVELFGPKDEAVLQSSIQSFPVQGNGVGETRGMNNDLHVLTYTMHGYTIGGAKRCSLSLTYCISRSHLIQVKHIERSNVELKFLSLP